jgi:hypothetical protein
VGRGEYDGELCDLVSVPLRVTATAAGSDTIRRDEYNVDEEDGDEDGDE